MRAPEGDAPDKAVAADVDQLPRAKFDLEAAARGICGFTSHMVAAPDDTDAPRGQRHQHPGFEIVAVGHQYTRIKTSRRRIIERACLYPEKFSGCGAMRKPLHVSGGMNNSKDLPFSMARGLSTHGEQLMRAFITGYSLIAVVGSLCAVSSAFADSPDAFLKKAIQGNIAEVKMGELAQKNAGSDGIKSFGKMLVTDHGKAKEQTVSLAKSMNITPPTEPTAEAQQTYDKLMKLNGAAFDKEFARHMVMDHKKDISEYEEEAKEKGNPQVSKYASDTLPTLKKHLETAQGLDK